LVVAPNLTAADIIAILQQQVDPVFLPRPLHLVEKLPRNETGKLPRQAVLAILESLGAGA
jgi:acyl-coenzyme A synthetase/AMP-(fatty) acid ligase